MAEKGNPGATLLRKAHNTLVTCGKPRRLRLQPTMLSFEKAPVVQHGVFDSALPRGGTSEDNISSERHKSCNDGFDRDWAYTSASTQSVGECPTGLKMQGSAKRWASENRCFL